MKLLTLLVAIILGASMLEIPALAATSVILQEDKKETRDVSDFNLEKGLALEGYDPVAYFPEGAARLRKAPRP